MSHYCSQTSETVHTVSHIQLISILKVLKGIQEGKKETSKPTLFYAEFSLLSEKLI